MTSYLVLVSLEIAMTLIVLFAYLRKENRITKVLAFIILVELVILQDYLIGDKGRGLFFYLIYAYWHILLARVALFLLSKAKIK